MIPLNRADKVKQYEFTEQDCADMVKDLLGLAITRICYERELFPKKYFTEKIFIGLDQWQKRLMPLDATSRGLIHLIDKGVYDAIQNKYLEVLSLRFCEASDGPMIEEYTFSFMYHPDSEGQDVSTNIDRSGNEKDEMPECNSTTELTQMQMRSCTRRFLDSLTVGLHTLGKMPEERTVLMKLLLRGNATPANYKPPFFQHCIEEGADNPWIRKPFEIEVGNFNNNLWTKTPLEFDLGSFSSKHLIIALKMKSVLELPVVEKADNQDGRNFVFNGDWFQLFE